MTRIHDKSTSYDSVEQRKPIEMTWSDYKWPLLFLLSMSMIGLAFPLGFIFVPLLLINRFRENRYDFLIMLTIVLGGFGFTAEGSYPVKSFDVAFLLSVILILVHRNRGIINKTVITWVVYCLFIIFISTFSDERFLIQFRLMRYTFLFSCFIIPIVCFTAKEFEIQKFFKALIPYVIIICIFYILDGLIICGFVFLPRTPLWGSIPESYFYSPIVFGFPSMVRKYPQGLILLALVVFPVSKFYRLRWWHWVLFIGACIACQTFTVISGIFVGYLVSVVNIRTILKYIMAVPLLLITIYFIDSFLPVTRGDGGEESFLRIKSSVDQVIELADIKDDIDLANFGSGRIGQALPKIELVNILDKELTGLGFLHPQLTTDPKYIIFNEYYLNSEKSEEVATQLIETEVLQVYVTTGYLGLIAYFIFYPLTYFYVRRYKYSRYYLTVLVMTFWFGMGAYGGWTACDGQILLTLAYGVTILSERRESE